MHADADVGLLDEVQAGPAREVGRAPGRPLRAGGPRPQPGAQGCLIDPGAGWGGSEAGRQPNFGGLVLGCIDADFCK